MYPADAPRRASRTRRAKQGVSVMDTTREPDEVLRGPPQADARTGKRELL